MTMPKIIPDNELGVIDPSKLIDDRPFINSIELTKVQIAGIFYLDDPRPVTELKIGDRLKLIREPENIFDARAIRIKDGKGRNVGYIPRSKNQIIANLMDGGKHVYCKVSSIGESYGDLTVIVSVMMDDY